MLRRYLCISVTGSQHGPVSLLRQIRGLSPGTGMTLFMSYGRNSGKDTQRDSMPSKESTRFTVSAGFLSIIRFIRSLSHSGTFIGTCAGSPTPVPETRPNRFDFSAADSRHHFEDIVRSVPESILLCRTDENELGHRLNNINHP